MARFYADIQGNRGPASRMGTPNSGIGGHIRGWNSGVSVQGRVENDNDVFFVAATGGSNGRHGGKTIAKITDEGDTMRVVLFLPDGNEVTLMLK